ncbi:MAG: hypothetical protein NG740_06570, partial [Omnitrophica bacterium]|nr:hypothetical protein [Candidatus Omnitrophota bacterium]
MFIWNQIAYAGDFFSFKPIPINPAIDAARQSALRGAPGVTDETVVTNYDLFSYKKRQSGIHKLLPTKREAEQSGGFSPAYLKRQQNKHEDVIRQKEAVDDLIELLINRKPRDDVALPLKKKIGGEDDTAKPYDYSLTDLDEFEIPHTLTDFINPTDLTETHKYDITMMNIDEWMAGAKSETDDDGVSYWLGHGEGTPDEDRLIMKVLYIGSGDSRKIDKIYLGYRLMVSGEYEAKYVIEYTYRGEDIEATYKYDISEGGHRLVEENLYEGSGENNRIKKTIYYGKTGKVINRRDFKYDDDGALKEVLLYETDSKEEDEGELIQRTVFAGEKGKELADYSQTFYEGEATETTVYYYKGGKRAKDAAEYHRYSKSKQITYRGNALADKDGDGIIDEGSVDEDGDGIDDNARKLSMLVYDSVGRLANEEMADYMVLYADGDIVVRTIVYLYGGKRAKDSNYREPMSSAVTYYGNLDRNGNGTIDPTELAQGVKASETFYDTLYRLKGEEVQDYTVSYLIDGETVAATTIYFYEGGKRAKDASNENRMEKSITYWGKVDENDNGFLDENDLAKAKKKSETFYRFKADAKRGEELADITLNYARDGETVKDTTVYFYKGNRRADEAGHRMGLERSATFWGDAAEGIELIYEGGEYNIDNIIDFIAMRFGIEIGQGADEFRDALLWAIALGDDNLIQAILSTIFTMDPANVYKMEDILDALLTVLGGDSELLLLLYSLDISGATKVEDAIRTMLEEAGMSAEYAALSQLIISLKTSSTLGEFIDNLISDAKGEGRKEELASLLLKIGLGREGSFQELKDKLKSMTSNTALEQILDESDTIETLIQKAKDADPELLEELLALLGEQIKDPSYYIQVLIDKMKTSVEDREMVELKTILETLESNIAVSPALCPTLEAFMAELKLRVANENSAVLSKDLLSVFLELGFDMSDSLPGFINGLIKLAESVVWSDKLRNFLDNLDQNPGSYTGLNGFINYVIAEAGRQDSTGLLRGELIGLLSTSMINPFDYVQGLASELLMLMAGDKYSVQSLIMLLTTIDLTDGITKPEDLLYTMIFTAGGTGLNELKNLLRDVDSTTASDLLNDVIGLSLQNFLAVLVDLNESPLLHNFLNGLNLSGEDMDTIEELLTYLAVDAKELLAENDYGYLQTLLAEIAEERGVALVLSRLVARLLTLVDKGRVEDAAFLSALIKLKEGIPSDLIYLLFSEIEPDALEPLLKVILNGQTDLLNLLLKVDRTLEAELREFLLEINPADYLNNPSGLRDELMQMAIGEEPHNEADPEFAAIFNLIKNTKVTDKIETPNDYLKALDSNAFLMELMAVHSDDDYGDGNSGNDVPDLIEIMLGHDPEDDKDFPVSFTYRHEIKDGAKLKGQTFFYIDSEAGATPKSVADFTLNYDRNGEIVKDTTIYYYEDLEDGPIDVRADDADSDRRKTRAITYKGDSRSSILDYDKDGLPDYLESFTGDYDGDGLYDFEDPVSHEHEGYGNDKDWYEDTRGTVPTDDDDEDIGDGSGNVVGDGIRDDAVRKTETFYAIRDDRLRYTMPGDEVADYTYSYAPDGAAVRDTTVYAYEIPKNNNAPFFENGLRAGYSFISSRKLKTITYFGDTIDSLQEDGIVRDAVKKTVTYYYFDSLIQAGEEIADYAHNYVNREGAANTIKSTSIFFYGIDKRASDANPLTDAMTKSESYRGEVTDV